MQIANIINDIMTFKFILTMITKCIVINAGKKYLIILFLSALWDDHKITNQRKIKQFEGWDYCRTYYFAGTGVFEGFKYWKEQNPVINYPHDITDDLIQKIAYNQIDS